MTTLRNVALALALAGAAATAHAGVKASAVTTFTYAFYSGATFVPLNNAGATTLSFNLGSPGKKVLTYSAICAVGAQAGDADATLDLDIYVNGVIVAPTATGGYQGVFCSSNGTDAFDGWTRPSITIPIQGISGNNTVRIRARGSSDGSAFWLGNSALVIYD